MKGILWFMLSACKEARPPMEIIQESESTLVTFQETPTPTQTLNPVLKKDTTQLSHPQIPTEKYFKGIPKDKIQNIDAQSFKQLQHEFTEHGWSLQLNNEEFTLELDYAKIFKNRPDLTSWAQYISTDKDPNVRLRKYVEYVQNLKYALPPMYEDELLIAEYWTASKVLRHQAGDCDSLSMLLANLVAVENVSVVLLQNSDVEVQHMVVGIEMQAKEGDLVTTIDGTSFVVFDTTINHPPSVNQRTFFEQHPFEIVRLSY